MKKLLLLILITGFGFASWGQSKSPGNSKTTQPAPMLPPPGNCTITGSTSVNTGINYTYTLSCAQTGVVWGASGGIVISSSNTSATIRWNGGLAFYYEQSLLNNGLLAYQNHGPSAAMTDDFLSPHKVRRGASTTGQVTATVSSNQIASLTVTIQDANMPLLAGSISPVSQTIMSGGSASGLTCTAASGGDGTAISYQWQKSTDSTTWNNIAGANTLSYDPGTLTVKTWYRVVVTQSGQSDYSNTAVINVNTPLTSGSISPGSQTVTSGTTALVLTCSAATGGDGTTISYQWQKSGDSTSWTNIAGAVSLSYAPGIVILKTWYRVKVTQSAQSLYSNASVVNITGPIATSLSADQNYIAAWTPIAPITDPVAVRSRPAADVRLQVQYFDGLGRSLQTVVRNGSLESATGTVKDVITPVGYDAFGRQDKIYLSYANGTGAAGSYRANALTDQQNFNQDKYASQQEGTFYNQTVFEASPLGRVLETFAPGQNWGGTINQVNEQNRHSAKSKYWINTAADSVRVWDVTDSAAITSYGSYSSMRMYAGGTLHKNVTVDEQGKQMIEFKDKEGQVILKKVQLTASADTSAGAGHMGWMCTYYLYDDQNQLRCVIQPEGVRQLAANGWVLTATIIAEQCFQYKYDERLRMIKKQVPGAADIYMVYDARDRHILTQDGNMRPLGQWLYTRYDALNRPVATGKWAVNNTTTYSFTNIRGAAYGSTGYTEPDSLKSKGTIDELTTTFYDNYNWITDSLYSNYIGNRLSANIDGTDTTGNLLPVSDSQFPYAQKLQMDSRTKGMVTGTRVKVLNDPSNRYIYTLTLYDDKGRPVQVKTLNQTNGVDVMTTQYSWSGQPLVVISRQNKASGVATTITTITKNTYDALGRVTQTTKRITNGTYNSGERVMALNKYDELGQLKEKTLAPTGGPGGGILETQKYEYNVRGWLLGMNRDYVKAGATGSYFGFDLAYDKTNNSNYSGTTPTNTNLNGYAGAGMFNGNITGMTWRGSNGTKEIRRYDFTYDAANRILNADFNQYTNSAYNKTANVDFSSKMGDGVNAETAYDYNGNIKAMLQKGLYSGSSPIIDQLSYTYQPGSNKLAKVADSATTVTTGLGDFKDGTNTDDDYAYDVNGNLTKDQNKKITSITYNFLNLPEQIKVLGKGIITYQYDAAGNKLSKTTTDSTVTPVTTKTTQYLGGMIFENDALQFVSTEEGRARLNGSTWMFDYMLKDHLGNVRATVAEGGTLLEESAYYPFGLTMKGIGYQKSQSDCGCALNKRGFNSNEIQNKEFNDGSGLELYDFNARTYGQQIGRFIQIDPTPEDGEQESLTPYHFSGNNPSTFNDPNGKCPWCIGAIIGAVVEYGTQVTTNLVQGKSLSESLTNVNGGAILISAAAGAASGGLSALTPKSAIAKAAIKGAELAVSAGESAAKQYKTEGRVDGLKVLTDVGAGIVGNAATKNVKVNSSNTIKTTEKQLDRAQRIAANDATSSGRAATVKKLETKVSSQKAANQGVQQAASGSVSNTMQAGVDAARGSKPVKAPTFVYDIYKPAVDNTILRRQPFISE